MLNKYPFLLLLLLPLLVQATILSGRVVDQETDEPISYVNIGVLQGERGTVSSDQGYFRLDLADISKESILRFSFIGYENFDVSVGDIEQKCVGLCEIKMIPQVLEFDEVLVYPREFKEKVVGNPHPPAVMKAGFTEDSLGYEVGVRCKIRNRPTLLEELRLHGIVTSYDSVFYRLNVYEMYQKMPGRNILREPIYVTLTNFDTHSEFVIDLMPYHIMVQDDFLITLEYVKELGEGELQFSTGMLSGKIFYRRTSQAEWHSAPLGLGMSVLISYEK